MCESVYALTSFNPGSCWKSPHAESNERLPLAATIKSKPLWFSIEPALPASFTSVYGRPHWEHKTGTPMAHWAASMPPTSTQSHKAVPHHQMWWSLVLILVWSLNSPADTVGTTHFTVVLRVWRIRWAFASTFQGSHKLFTQEVETNVIGYKTPCKTVSESYVLLLWITDFW